MVDQDGRMTFSRQSIDIILVGDLAGQNPSLAHRCQRNQTF